MTKDECALLQDAFERGFRAGVERARQVVDEEHCRQVCSCGQCCEQEYADAVSPGLARAVGILEDYLGRDRLHGNLNVDAEISGQKEYWGDAYQ